jgi:hypothetical protein
MLGVDLIELGPDQPVVVEVEPAGERDLSPGRQEYLAVGALLRRQEVTVDHCCGESDHHFAMRSLEMSTKICANAEAIWLGCVSMKKF